MPSPLGGWGEAEPGAPGMMEKGEAVLSPVPTREPHQHLHVVLAQGGCLANVCEVNEHTHPDGCLGVCGVNFSSQRGSISKLVLLWAQGQKLFCFALFFS